MQGRPEEVARRVAGEDPARPIAAVRGGSQADEQDPRVRVAEPRYRQAPVRLVAEAFDLLARDQFAPGDEARAAPARDDLGGECRERRPIRPTRSVRRAAQVPPPIAYLSSSLSSRRETTSRPTTPMTSRYATWNSRTGLITPTVSARRRSTPW